jgi:hypothetical protein
MPSGYGKRRSKTGQMQIWRLRERPLSYSMLLMQSGKVPTFGNETKGQGSGRRRRQVATAHLAGGKQRCASIIDLSIGLVLMSI